MVEVFFDRRLRMNHIIEFKNASKSTAQPYPWPSSCFRRYRQST